MGWGELASLECQAVADGNQENFVLHLGPESLTLAGTVYGSDRTPLPDVEVYLLDATRPGSGSSFVVEKDGDATDDSGRFRLSGLSHRPYTLRASLRRDNQSRLPHGISSHTLSKRPCRRKALESRDSSSVSWGSCQGPAKLDYQTYRRN